MDNISYCNVQVTGLTALRKEQLIAAIEDDRVLEYCQPEPDWLLTPNGKGELPSGVDDQGTPYWSDGKSDLRSHAWRLVQWGTKSAAVDVGSSLIVINDSIECNLLSMENPPTMAFRHFAKRHRGSLVVLRYRKVSEDLAGVMVAGSGGYRCEEFDCDELLDCAEPESSQFSPVWSESAIDQDLKGKCLFEELNEEQSREMESVFRLIALSLIRDIGNRLFNVDHTLQFSPRLRRSGDLGRLDRCAHMMASRVQSVV